ncbi:hypothetical protein [Allosediminivita pacifica]|uniref:Uncharacterized protein n=1 Tax=Allosediminivita pacifica TaxID=1267769 RepID=A0A2T6B5F0_9RHOB|nr:hypothetical protein [Allosediminivita pacifica]PTX51311.1 hypothetical protein C8N44_10354 [Allosediminivita pacifica]GGA98793.1 hypothetical protein GCM10011324_06290 [Allosediminivita pacifica]
MTKCAAIDGHVHIHPRSDLARLLNAALGNVRHHAGPGAEPCLLLTETSGTFAFDAICEGTRRAEGWSLERHASDPAAIRADNGTDGLSIIAGQQIVTRERLEVLALATCHRHPDGAPLGDTLAALRAARVPAVLPWGLGKWMGQRGKIIAETLSGAGPKPLLGDNKGRPRGWPTPGAFSADSACIVLPGSDPLPIPGSEEIAGSYGFLLDPPLDPDRPAAELSERLLALDTQPPTFGSRMGPFEAARVQVALRRHKKAGPAA